MEPHSVSPISDITQKLLAAKAGDAGALDGVFNMLYPELRRLAHGQRRDARSDTLNTTGLVHECWLRIARSDATMNDRGHFFALAARVMRQVLVDYARERATSKRGGNQPGISLSEAEQAEISEASSLVELDDLLNQLAKIDQRQASVVECRFFAGLSEPETALALDISERSVQRDWHVAREWLREHGGF
jgi:RNA polymerase sigma factor (TIGR02999 family)